MKIGITPRFEKSRFDEPWYAFEESLVHLARKLLPQAEIELLLPGNDYLNMEFQLIILGGGSTPGDDKSRDHFENSILDHATKEEISVLGICRGAQMIARFFGGKLMQVDDHVNRLRRLTKHKQDLGRCFHRYTVSELPRNFEVIDRDDVDNSIEIFLDRSNKLLGIMSHPERQQDTLRNFCRFYEEIHDKCIS